MLREVADGCVEREDIMFRHVVLVVSISLLCSAILLGSLLGLCYWGLSAIGLLNGGSWEAQSFCSQDDRYCELPFDETHWKAGAGIVVSAKNHRSKMMNDLLKTHVQPGMSKESIEELLGPPDSAYTYWSYELSIRDFKDIKGPSGGHRFVICLDKDGKYVSSEIMME